MFFTPFDLRWHSKTEIKGKYYEGSARKFRGEDLAAFVYFFEAFSENLVGTYLHIPLASPAPSVPAILPLGMTDSFFLLYGRLLPVHAPQCAPSTPSDNFFAYAPQGYLPPIFPARPRWAF